MSETNVKLNYKTIRGYAPLYPRNYAPNMSYNNKHMANRPPNNLRAMNLEDALIEIDDNIAQVGRVFKNLTFGSGQNVDIIDEYDKQVSLENYCVGNIIYFQSYYYMLLYTKTKKHSIIARSKDGIIYEKWIEKHYYTYLDMKCNDYGIWFAGYETTDGANVVRPIIDFYQILSSGYRTFTVVTLTAEIRATTTPFNEMSFNLDNETIVFFPGNTQNRKVYLYTINNPTESCELITTSTLFSVPDDIVLHIKYLRDGQCVCYSPDVNKIAIFTFYISTSSSYDVFSFFTNTGFNNVSDFEMSGGKFLINKRTVPNTGTLYCSVIKNEILDLTTDYKVEPLPYGNTQVIQYSEKCCDTIFINSLLNQSSLLCYTNDIGNTATYKSIIDDNDDVIYMGVGNSSELYENFIHKINNRIYIYNGTKLYYSQIKI